MGDCSDHDVSDAGVDGNLDFRLPEFGRENVGGDKVGPDRMGAN